MTAPVLTTNGPVLGVETRRPGITAYLGIPYGASTAGAGRWREPRPPQPWHSPRRCAEFGPICPQPGDMLPGIPRSEDCLNLNVWTPAAPGEATPLRPVFVWVHGGRFLFGASAEPAYDGTALAERGAVVVSINYRMGPYGFLATSDLSAESGHGSGNYGLLDVILALQWVQDNAAAFGGDPARVTVAGQSCGGAIGTILLYSPLGKGLFNQVLIESAALYPKDPTISTLAASHRVLAEAEEDGAAYLRLHNATSAAALRSAPAEALLAGTTDPDPRIPGNPGPPLMRPTVDGYVLPTSYWEALSTGALNEATVILGNNRDESGVLVGDQRITLEDYRSWAAETYGDLAPEMLSLYPADDDASATAAYNSALRDGMRVSAQMWAAEYRRHVDRPVRSYFWTHAPLDDPSLPPHMHGAHHGSEIPFFLGSLDADTRAYSATDRAVAARVAPMIAAYVLTGTPEGEGLPAWPATADQPETMSLGETCEMILVATPQRRSLIARHLSASAPW